MQKKINITKSTLLTRVRLTLAYHADRNPAMTDRYQEAVMTTDDASLATQFLEDAMIWTASALKRYGGEVDLTTDKAKPAVCLLMISSNSLAAKTSIIDDVITSAVENRIVSDWLMTIGDTESQERYRTRATGYVEEAIELCTRKVRPAPASKQTDSI